MGSCGSCGENERCLTDSCMNYKNDESWANNGVCDEPELCYQGTDCSDCGTCGSELGFMATCVPTPPGDQCSNAVVVEELPFLQQGDTTGYDNDYEFGTEQSGGYPWSVCGGSTQGHRSPDKVYRFTPDETGYYTIEVDTHPHGSSDR